MGFVQLNAMLDSNTLGVLNNRRLQMTLASYLGRNLTLDNELKRTAEMLVDITEKQGIYFAIAFYMAQATT